MSISSVPCGSSTGLVNGSPIWERRVRVLSFPVKESLPPGRLRLPRSLSYHRYTLSSSIYTLPHVVPLLFPSI